MSSPRTATYLFAIVLGLFAMAGRCQAQEAPKPEKLWVYVGTYTGGKSKGIYRLEMDPATGKLTGRELVAETPNPTFLAIHPNKHFLYAVNEIGNFKDKKSGAISAYAIDAKTGGLTLLNQQPTGGDGPCHLVLGKEGKHVLAANYGGGSTCVVPIGADGKLGEGTDFVQHKGSSVNKQRQEGPHAHCVDFDAANHFAFVCDLGLDKVLVFKYDAANGKLTPNDPPSASLKGGAGPRHIAFHPNGHFAYVNNEIDSTVTAMSYNADHGALKSLQTLSTLPKEFTGGNSTAEVEVHPSGKFVYVSNRGHNSIAIFTVDAKTGELTAAGHQAKGIKTPRNFAIEPSGTHMIVANQDGDSLVVFRIDAKTGELAPTGIEAEVPAPVCVTFIPQGR
ncbi:MAG TPA: lactonase family protein [Gemmataceae bacterium]